MSSHQSTFLPINQFPYLRVLVVGDAILDGYLQGTADRLCSEGPVPVVAINQRQEAPGGAGNTAANLAALGAKALLLSVLGQDGEGERLQELLSQQNVDSHPLLISPSRFTLAKQRVLAEGQLLVRFDTGSTLPLTPELEQTALDRLNRLFPRCDAVIISDYGYGMLTPRLIEGLADLQAQHAKVLVVDAKHLNRYQPLGATAVKPNYNEAVQLLGLPKLVGSARIPQIRACRDALFELTGAQAVVVTLDAEGGLLFEQNQSEPYRFQAEPVDGLRTIGAGDTFVAALTLALAAGVEITTATMIASQAATIALQQLGTTTCPLGKLQQLQSTPPCYEHRRLASC